MCDTIQSVRRVRDMKTERRCIYICVYKRWRLVFFFAFCVFSEREKTSTTTMTTSRFAAEYTRMTIGDCIPLRPADADVVLRHTARVVGPPGGLVVNLECFMLRSVDVEGSILRMIWMHFLFLGRGRLPRAPFMAWVSAIRRYIVDWGRKYTSLIAIKMQGAYRGGAGGQEPATTACDPDGQEEKKERRR